MARPKDPKLERIWRQHLLRHSTSGLSITEFCVQAGVTCSAFFYWKRRLASNGGYYLGKEDPHVVD